jgi:alpha-L-fucosidase 2
MKTITAIRTIVPLFLVAAFASGQATAKDWPPESLDLMLTAPINSWDEAVPLGNGLTGGLLWGENNRIKLSLDRGDLWDERPAAGKDWWKQRTWARGGDWESPYNGATPTKLPAGRLEIALPSDVSLQRFELNLATARGFAQLKSGQEIETFFSAAEPFSMIRIPGPSTVTVDLIPAGAGKEHGNAGPSSGGAVARLGYPPAERGRQGGAAWFVQTAAEGLKYCVCVETRHTSTQTVLAIAITSNRNTVGASDAADPLAIARKHCKEALDEGYDATLRRHVAWWRTFWSQSSLTVPDPAVMRYYAFARYLYGAGSRRGAPPMPLQGVWTADNGGLPPWKGDYHNDLNTQMTYIAYQTAGQFDEGASYLDFLWNLRPTFRQFAHDFYDTPGLAVPGVMSLAGQPLGGWKQYVLSPTMTSWSAHLFYLHWRYTADDKFLRTRAYPWCKEAGECLRALLKPDANGILKLLRSSSPEIFDNSPRAWLIPNTNYDLMCLKMQFLCLAEMADAIGKAEEAKTWSETAKQLGGFHVDQGGALLMDAKTPLPYSHRHLSNLMGIYPFNLITVEGGTEDQRRIRASLESWDRLGTSQWCGYSWAWMSCLRARVGDADAALRDLHVFIEAFVLRNGFHCNGDQTKKGYSSMHYRPFTLEGNFLAMQAVQEMLLQSWSPTPGVRDREVIRLFPATPASWHDVSFTDLRAEGGHKVSARREGGVTTWFRLTAGKDGVVRVRDSFGGRTPKWTREGVKKVGNNFEVNLTRGETLEGSMPVAAPQH